MRRKAHNRLWTFILMLLLCGASLGPAVRIARADTVPTDSMPGSPPGDPQAGDPDSPDGSGRSLRKPGPTRGVSGQVTRTTVPQSPFGMWMLRLRMAFASVYRILFHF